MLDIDRKVIIVYLIDRLKKDGKSVGKIYIQKFIYFLQVFGVHLEYKYKFYHYGPYCPELAEDIESMETLKVITISPNISAYGYDIRLGEYANEFKTNKNKFLKNNNIKFDEIINSLKMFYPQDLELMSTLHYVKNVMNKNDKGLENSIIVQKTKELKPKFDDKKIEESLHILFDLEKTLNT